MSKKIVVDASALLALMQEEKGSEQVEKHLSNAIISSVNFSEVISVLISIGIAENEALTLTSDLVSDIISFDSNQAYQAAQLRAITKKYGLSLGDRACIALGQQYKTTILTADKIWDKLQLENVLIEVIR